MPEVGHLRSGLAADARSARERARLRGRRRAGGRHGRLGRVQARSADLVRHVGLPVVVVVVVGVGDDRRAARVERDLEVVEQVPVRGSERPARRDVAAVDEVVARRDLAERRVGRGRVVALRVEDLPVGAVDVRSGRGAVPDDPDRARSRAGLEPREQARRRARTVAHLHRLAPGRALVDGVGEEDVVAVRVGDVDRAVRRAVVGDLHDEEDVRHAASRRLVADVVERGGGDVRRRRRARADLTARSADVDGAGRLVHVDLADLADRAGGGGGPVRQAAVVRALDLRDRRSDRAVEQVDTVLPVELLPLAVVDRRACRHVPERVLREGDALVGRLADRDVREDEAGEGKRRRIRGRTGAWIGPSDREVDVAAAVCADGRLLVTGERVGLAAVDPVPHVRVAVQVVVPEVDAGRNAADPGDVEVARRVGAAARLAVARGDRSLRRHVRAERDSAVQIGRRPGGRLDLRARRPVVLLPGDGEVDDVDRERAGAFDRRVEGRLFTGSGRAAGGVGHDGARVRALVDVEVEVVRRDEPGDAHVDDLAGPVGGGSGDGQRVGVAVDGLDAGRLAGRRTAHSGAVPGNARARRIDRPGRRICGVGASLGRREEQRARKCDREQQQRPERLHRSPLFSE